jgi:hypothetical protein
MIQILKIDTKDEEESTLPPYKAAEHYYRDLQTAKKRWAPLSSCWDLEVGSMFPRSHAQEVALAKEVCTTCPVAKECLKLAIVNQEEYGIWGGYSSREIQTEIKNIKSKFGNIWISWNDQSLSIVNSLVSSMNKEFVKTNNINEKDLIATFKDRLDDLDQRLSEFKL